MATFDLIVLADLCAEYKQNRCWSLRKKILSICDCVMPDGSAATVVTDPLTPHWKHCQFCEKIYIDREKFP